MTDAERLVIAEEVIRKLSTPFLLVDLDDGIRIQCLWKGSTWVAYRPVEFSTLLERDNLFDCVAAARQKLAAENEAARTPDERRLMAEVERLRKALTEVNKLTESAQDYTNWQTVWRFTKEALEGA